MKKQKWFLFSMITVTLMGLTACNNKKNSTPPPPGCPSGQIATPAGCSPPGNVTPPVGYIQPPSNGGLVQYYSSKTDFLSPQDTLTPTQNWVNFLRDALGVCDRCQTTIGQAVQCDSWVRGFNMVMLSFAANQSSLAQMAFYTTPYITQTYYQFAWQFPKIEDFFITLFTGAPAPSCNPGQFSPYWATQVTFETQNNGEGFVVYVNNGPLMSRWNLYKLRLYVAKGKIGDQSFNYQLTAIDKSGHSGDLATGTLTRCKNPNCSMF